MIRNLSTIGTLLSSEMLPNRVSRHLRLLPCDPSRFYRVEDHLFLHWHFLVEWGLGTYRQRYIVSNYAARFDLEASHHSNDHFGRSELRRSYPTEKSTLDYTLLRQATDGPWKPVHDYSGSESWSHFLLDLNRVVGEYPLVGLGLPRRQQGFCTAPSQIPDLGPVEVEAILDRARKKKARAKKYDRWPHLIRILE